MIEPEYTGLPAVVVGTGPSLGGQLETLRRLRAEGRIRLFGVNQTWRDLPVDVLICCDPAYHRHYGRIEGDFRQFHWDRSICDEFDYEFVQGGWMVDGRWYPREEYEHPPGNAGGLWLEDRTRISLNHCSAAQALNLAAHFGCSPLLLAGHDFSYQEQQRHYFTDLSDEPGEYPQEIRKFSKFDKQGQGDDLLQVYRRIAIQEGRPPIINVTPGSKLPWFPMEDLECFLSTSSTCPTQNASSA